MPLFPTRGEGPSNAPSYSNADLARFMRPKLGVQVEKPDVPADSTGDYDFPQNSVDQLLADAKGTLASSGQFADSLGHSSDDMDAEREALAQSSENGSVTNGTNGLKFRDVTRGMNKLAPPVAALGMAAGLSGIGAPAAPFLMGTADALAVPDIARRLIAPERNESRGGAALEGALYAVPLAVRGLRAAGSALSTERAGIDAANSALDADHLRGDVVKGTVEAATDMRNGGATTEQASQRAGWPLGQSSASPVSYNTTPISDIMDGSGGAFTRTQNPMDALRKSVSPSSGLGGSSSFGRPQTPGVKPSVGRDEIAALRELLRQHSARSMASGY